MRLARLTRTTVFELTLPNSLTIIRILLVPVLVAVLLSQVPEADAVAAGIFAVASGTDALDGWIARRKNSESAFGKLMDPLADKLLITAALVSLVALYRLQAWVAMVIIAREFAVTGLRLLAMEQGHLIAASVWGKLKTTSQVAMVLALIWVGRTAAWVDALVWVTVVITVASGADYFFRLRRLLASPPQARPSSHSRMET
jgi:CDP-diacylglycerol--glycerol-3-phosphate 3-phosphatidyltransferase